MKKLVLLLALPLSGCFVFIPGSVVSKISDGITGDKGEHCVTRAAKVGDKIRDRNFNKVYTVVSLSGTSSRCTNPDYPVRAEMAMEIDRQAVLTDASKPLPAAPPEPPAATAADKAAACAKLAAVKPGAPQEEFQAAWADLNKLGMTWRDCK